LIENSYTIVLNATKRLLKQSEMERLKIFENFRTFYLQDYAEMWKIISQDLIDRKLFSDETLEKVQYQHIDHIQKTLNRLSAGIYDEEPERTIGGKPSDELNNAIKKTKYNSKVLEALRKALFVNTVIANPLKRGNKIDIDILMPDVFSAITTEDYLTLTSIVLQRYNAITKELYGLYWSVEENYIIDADGNKEDITNGEKSNNGVNPFYAKYKDKSLPVSVLRLNDGDDFYGEPNWNLYNAQLANDMDLTNLHFMGLFNYFPIRIGINLPLAEGDTLAPNKLFNAKDVKKEDAPPNLLMVKPEVDWNELRTNIEWRFKMTAMAMGIPSSSSALDTVAQSGAAKNIDEVELKERRETLTAKMYDFELDALDKLRMVWNTYAGEIGEPLIPEGDFEVVFQEPQMNIPVKDRILLEEHDLKFDLTNPVKLLMQRDEIDEEQAKKDLAINKEQNKDLSINNVPPAGLQNGTGVN